MKTDKYTVESLRIQSIEDAAEAMRAIGTTDVGIHIMREKAVFAPIRVEEVNTKAANILKQTYLSKGGEAAVSKHSADLSEDTTDVLIFATLAQHRASIQVLRLQPWGLSELADQLRDRLSL
ncbi:hypothetical protein TAMA11512_05980 [Selenomonas sp. TAMA-11512]|uniref:dihydropteroate synthase n=1 Tax=Selenomonas sp. TAMA-11512 TaxID=3095337 RepID=UPI0030927B80|nr:hypothetical protein TAMA11512_05980 [Selenomonas sp. TAMA-11512]